jgi:putative oxidoreductase
MKDFVKLNPDLGLLAIRLALGAGFLVHGVAKLNNLPMTIGFFGTLGLPSFMAYVVAGVEVLAGAAMVLGIYTQLAGLGIVAIMLSAIYLVKMKSGYMGGYELEFNYLMSAVGVMLLGPGQHTAMNMMKKPATPNQPQA